MEYITAQQAAEKWGIHLRMVQNYCAQGRVAGAYKYQRSWMIPAMAKKPCSKNKGTDYNSNKTFLVCGLFTWAARNFEEVKILFDVPSDDRYYRLQYECELAGLKGDFEKAKETFIETPMDAPTKLLASITAIEAADRSGDKQLFQEIKEFLEETYKNTPEENDSQRKFINNILAANSLNTENIPEWLKVGDFSNIENSSVFYCLYIRIRYLRMEKRWAEMRAVANTVLAISRRDALPVVQLHMHLLCASANIALREQNHVKKHLEAALEIGEREGFISPFSASAISFGGLLEQCAQEKYREFYNEIVKQWQETWEYWVTNHNGKASNARLLTLRQVRIAIMVTKQMSYAEIAENEGISVGRVGNIIQEIYGKLQISTRKELSDFSNWS